MSAKPLWQRWKYFLSGLLLVLPVWYLYASLNPQFPPEWDEQPLGPVSAAPMPFDSKPPYTYDGERYKDFSVRLCERCMQQLRVAYLSVGAAPAPVPEDDKGILHGGDTHPEAHAPFPAKASPDARLWLSVQQWDGALHHASWPLPAEWR